MKKLLLVPILVFYINLWSQSPIDLTTELNRIIGITPGAASSNKVLCLNANRSIFGMYNMDSDTGSIDIFTCNRSTITSGTQYFANGYRFQFGPYSSASMYRNSDLIWSYDISPVNFWIQPPTRIASSLTINGDTAATKPWVLSVITESGGASLTDNILHYNLGGNYYEPHTSLSTGGLRIYTGTENPTGTTRLNINADLFVTRLNAYAIGSTPGFILANAGPGYGGYTTNTGSGYGFGIDNSNAGIAFNIYNNYSGSGGIGLNINNAGTSSSGLTLEGTMGTSGYSQATIYSRGAYSNGLLISTGTGVGVSTGSLLRMEKVKSGTNNVTGSFITMIDNPTTTGTLDGAVLEYYTGSTPTNRLLLYPRTANGGMAYLFDTENTLTSGYRARFGNHGSNYTDIQYDGSINIPSATSYKAGGMSVLYCNINDNNTAVGLYSNNSKLGGSNTTVGYHAGEAIQAGAAYNTLIGTNAGNAITSGDGNVALGYLSLFRTTTGLNNIGIGWSALEDVVTGSENVAIGLSAAANTTGSYNVAIGTQALVGNTTGTYNIAIGWGALSQVTNRSDNIAIGYQTISALNAGAGNVAVGSQALNVTTGTYNSAIGYGASASNTSGSYNSFLGYYSGFGVTTGSNVAGLGSYAGRYNATLNNRIYLNTLDRSTQAGDTTLSPIYIKEGTTTANTLIKLNGNSYISDSLYLSKLLDLPERNHQWLGLTPTGAVYADSLSNAGFMLNEPLNFSMASFMGDRVGGEVKWFYRENGETKYSYGINKLRPTLQIQALMAASEMDKRYIVKLEDKIQSLEERIKALENILLLK